MKLSKKEQPTGGFLGNPGMVNTPAEQGKSGRFATFWSTNRPSRVKTGQIDKARIRHARRLSNEVTEFTRGADNVGEKHGSFRYLS
jgi:hypothetical protein